MIKQHLYRTARATVSCAAFKAGDFVPVEYYWTDEGGTDWYLIHIGGISTAYPAHHLTEFCL